MGSGKIKTPFLGVGRGKVPKPSNWRFERNNKPAFMRVYWLEKHSK